MSRTLRLDSLPAGLEGKSKTSSVTSRLHYRSRGTPMEKDGKIASPRISRQSSFTRSPSNPSIDGLYPPQRSQPEDANARSAKRAVAGDAEGVPKICGLPLKYVSLVTLALQNTSLVIIMHYSRVSVASNTKVYSAASAVLIVEVLKCAISFAIAFMRTAAPLSASSSYDFVPATPSSTTNRRPAYLSQPSSTYSIYLSRLRCLLSEIGSTDAWKLSIPALLYVLQNNLQYIALSNLDVPTFQVTNQMKILTTAGFSVLLLHRKLSRRKWASLALLAIGVGIVQIQTASESFAAVEPPLTKHTRGDVYGGGGGNTVDPLPLVASTLHPLTGFLAVSAACFTSGLAGVYFEMVLKGSTADLWVRNVQMSSWSIIPALIPVLVGFLRDGTKFRDIFANFGAWAWCTVLMQAFGGLITALVIKYSDNILKGFATSLSIVLSFLASVALFNLPITVSFLVGAGVVLGATWMYNISGEQKKSPRGCARKAGATSALRHEFNVVWDGEREGRIVQYEAFLGNGKAKGRRPLSLVTGEQDPTEPSLVSPIESHEPLLGYPNYQKSASEKSKSSMGERLLGKVSGVVGFATTEGSQEAVEAFTTNSRGHEPAYTLHG